MPESKDTLYASAQRADSDTLILQKNMITSATFLEELINTISDVAMILNEHRQVLYSNQVLMDLLGLSDKDQLMGLRPGEVLNCIHSGETTGGCGTTSYCSVCDAVNTVLDSQNSLSKVTRECRVTVAHGDTHNSLDLSVTASTILLSNQRFTLLSVSDISDKKRKFALEKIFFHDVINTASGIKGLVDLMSLSKTSVDHEGEDILSVLKISSSTLLEEIMSQRDLSLAENNELNVKLSLVHSLDLIQEVSRLYGSPEICRNIIIKIDASSQSVEFETDQILLKRVLGNLLKNAIEASSSHMTVTLGTWRKNHQVVFSVHNETFMPLPVQMQVFQRSFSTKGANRGLGSYSIKLLTERYLHGTVSFESHPEQGTTFEVSLPAVTAQR